MAKGKRILGILGAAVLLCAVLGYASRVLQRKDADTRLGDFFTCPEQLDVLFFGSSHMEGGVAPMELWKDYGITSYDCAVGGGRMPLTYWMLRSTLEYAAPKLVVIDCYWATEDLKAPERSHTHQALDAFPAGPVKVQAILDLYGENGPDGAGLDFFRLPYAQLAEYLWDFTVYHERWNELTRQDFATVPSPQKGAELYATLFPKGNTTPLPRSEKWQGDTVGLQYLRRIIDECQSRGIEVLLTYLPFSAPERAWREANCIYDIAEEYGVPYLNMLDMGIVDYRIDCADADSHINPSGVRKVTKWLGSYLCANYPLADHRGDAAFAGWDENYRAYTLYKGSLLKEAANLDRYLMLLADDHLDLLLEITDPLVLTDESCRDYFQNIGVDVEGIPPGTPVLLARRGGQEMQVLPLPAQPDARYSTVLGEVAYSGTAVSLDGQECMAALYGGADVGVRIAVFGGDDGALLDTAKFARATRTAIR